WTVYYQWFLFAGLMLLLFSLVPFKLVKPAQPIVSILLTTVFISLLFGSSSELYADADADANKSADEKSISDSVLQESVKNYNKQEYALATSGFMAIILQAKTDTNRAKAMHNLGNNYFQQGDYENAAQLYEDALRYAPNQTQSQNNLLLTTELNDLLQRRRRRGVGLRSNQASGRGFLGSQNQTASKAESRMAKPKNLKLPEIPKEYLNDLLSKGLAHLQMLDSEQTKEERKKQRNIEQARISLLQDQDSSLDMWKRLFEVEEGFPAKLDVPKSVPGQQPW
ncbi:MAG: tetratricopeptide repeat protein, partial [Ghiorsea sp.]|nr:tetratricopeptide repeat protein [Ghiorsea sp.]